MEVMELSRKIMDYLGAFKGSRPVVHNPEAMIIRGKAEHKLKPEEILPKLNNLFKDLGIKKVQVNSEKARVLTPAFLFLKTMRMFKTKFRGF